MTGMIPAEKREALEKWGIWKAWSNCLRRCCNGQSADSEGSRRRIRDDVAQHSDLISEMISPGIPG